MHIVGRIKEADRMLDTFGEYLIRCNVMRSKREPAIYFCSSLYWFFGLFI